MEKSLLIVYASKYGGTREIAERIAENLTTAGIGAVVQQCDQPADISACSGVILGSAVYMGQWRKPAVSFLKRNLEALVRTNVWLFSSGPTGEGNPVEQLQGWRYPSNIQKEIDLIQPRKIAVFHGRLDRARINAFERWITGKVGAKQGDFRQWDRIDSWTNSIIHSLQD